jgi:hypothetical protein
MIQLAWRMLIFQKDSALVQWCRARTADGAPKTRKTMIVALARKLFIALRRMVTTGEIPEGFVLRPAVAALNVHRIHRIPHGKNVTGCRCRSEAAASRSLQWLQRRHGEWGRFRGTSPRMRMTASWWVSLEATEYKVVLRHGPRTLAGLVLPFLSIVWAARVCVPRPWSVFDMIPLRSRYG